MKTIHVETYGNWTIRLEGFATGFRRTNEDRLHHPLLRDATIVARELAERVGGATVVVHNQDGSIRSSEFCR